MRHRSFRAAAVFLSLLAVLLTMTSCKGSKTTIRTQPDGGLVSPDGGTALRAADPARAEKLASQDGLTFGFDAVTGAIMVAHGSGIWSALPFESGSTPCVISLKVFDGKESRVLDSQSDCAVYGGFSYTRTENRIDAVCVFSGSKETAAKPDEELTDGEMRVTLPLCYQYENGMLSVSVDMAQVKLSDGLVLESISLLPYFCSVGYGAGTPESVPSDGEEEETRETDEKAAEKKDDPMEDFILVPDGCGAVIYTKISGADYNEKCYAVYGSAEETACNAPLGAFGIRLGDRAIAAAVTEGEALCEIRTASASAKTSLRHIVYPVFRVTETSRDDGKIRYSDTYGGKLSVSYRFLSGEQATVTGMAAAVRAILIRNGVIPDAAQNESSLPLNIELVGSTDGKRSGVLSDLEAAEDFLSVLKAKGFNNVKLIMNGYLSGGLSQETARSAALLRSAGGKKDFASLCGYAKKQGYEVYLAADVMHSAGTANAAEDLNGQKTVMSVRGVNDGDKKELVLEKAARMERGCIRLMNRMKDLGADGFELLDVNEPLTVDVGSGIGDRQEAADQIGENAASFGTLGRLMISGGNVHTLKQADEVIGLPFYTAVEESEAYKAVPFLPAILHSSVVYSGAPVNGEALPRLEMLKTVEYGGVPYFRWALSGNSLFYYENRFSEAVDFCTDAAGMLSDLSDKRITGHEEVSDGVFRTTYSSGTIIYVNYNNFSVNIGSIAVMPYDYIRIN